MLTRCRECWGNSRTNQSNLSTNLSKGAHFNQISKSLIESVHSLQPSGVHRQDGAAFREISLLDELKKAVEELSCINRVECNAVLLVESVDEVDQVRLEFGVATEMKIPVNLPSPPSLPPLGG